MLRVETVDAYYGLSHVLQGVSLTVEAGEAVALLGRNGAGKTTTLKTIMAVLRARRGRITWNGDDITALPPYRIVQLGIGYVPEERRIFPNLSVYENLKMARLTGAAWTSTSRGSSSSSRPWPTGSPPRARR